MGELVDISEVYHHSPDLTERIMFRTHAGDFGELKTGIADMKLLIELKRHQAAVSLAEILKRQLRDIGFIVIADIDNAVDQFCERELLDKDLPPAA